MKTWRYIPCAVLLSAILYERAADAAEIEPAPPGMITIPSGVFTMGSPKTENGRDFWPFVVADETQHEVTITQLFYMKETEVTKAEWDDVWWWATFNGYSDLSEGRNGFNGNDFGNHPVTEVSWYDAVKWCNAKSEMEERPPVYFSRGEVYRTGKDDAIVCDWNTAGYRLPTEAEWEYACRSGTTTAFYTGNLTQLFDSKIDPNLNAAGWYSANNRDNTHPVARKQANAWGLYDMHGNVYEWCWDWHEYSNASAVTDPHGPATAPWKGPYRVMRGGSWRHGARVCRSAARDSGTGPWEKSIRGADLGFRFARSITSTPIPDWQGVIGGTAPPPRPTYGEPPKRLPGKDSLIIVTHGWNPDLTWVEAMTNAITAYLRANGLNNWQVHAHKWVKGARTPPQLGLLGAELALRNGRDEGAGLGRYLVADGWLRIHLIAHSAGSALTQAANDAIRGLLGNRKSVVTHLTFLDPFVGLTYGGKEKYGLDTDWADNYFARDPDTVLTDKVLPHVYNVDVTWLDLAKEPVTIVYSAPSGDVSQTCYQQVTSHSWPYQFYTGTIPPNTVIGSEGFGFPLGKEGGNWNFATNTYKAGMLKVLGKEEPSCVPNPSSGLISTGPVVDFSKLPSASVFTSLSGNVTIRGVDFTLRTASPAWLAVEIPIASKVNLVSFETRFTSALGAEGLLSVYWGTNVIGSVDERVASSGVERHILPLPEEVSSGTRVLGFRLDAFSAMPSSVLVTNVVLGFAGVREPFSLSVARTGGDRFMLRLTGPRGFNYRLESSTNLLDWSTIALLVNTNGTVRFTDQRQTNTTPRFYRAVVP